MAHCCSTRTSETTWPPIDMPRMERAALSPSSGVFTSLMPPDLPRLPVGTCALTTLGPILATASDASSGVVHTSPFGVGTPAGASTLRLAANSSRFIVCFLSSVTRPMRAEQLFLRRLVFGDRHHEMGDVEEMLVV